MLLALLACAGEGKPPADTDLELAPSVANVDTLACLDDPSLGESWTVALTVDDPQGAETVAGGTASVRNPDGNELAIYQLACADGACFTSFRADYDGIVCAFDGSFVFQVRDTEWHYSDTLAHEL